MDHLEVLLKRVLNSGLISFGLQLWEVGFVHRPLQLELWHFVLLLKLRL